MLRTTSILLLSLFMSCLGIAQQNQTEDPVARELGLRFSGFDDFNLFYKKAIGADKYRRHRFLFGRVAYNSSRADFDFNVGYALGTEKRKPIADKLSFIHGWDFSLSASYANRAAGNDRNNQYLLNPAIGYVLGFQLDISDSFALSAEVIPSIRSTIGIYDNGDNLYQFAADLNSNGTALSLMYRF